MKTLYCANKYTKPEAEIARSQPENGAHFFIKHLRGY